MFYFLLCIWVRFGLLFQILDFSSHSPQFNFEGDKVVTILKESMDSTPRRMSWKNEMNKLFCKFKDIPCTKC